METISRERLQMIGRDVDGNVWDPAFVSKTVKNLQFWKLMNINLFSAGLNNRYVNNYALFEVSVYQKTRILKTEKIEYLPRVVFVEVIACI